jgi:DNA-binding MarR family transcriptional regulator
MDKRREEFPRPHAYMTAASVWLDAIRRLKPTASTGLAQTFILVALHEGASVKDICKLSGQTQSTASRNLMDLGEVDSKLQPGLGLVYSRPNPTNRRLNQYFLTEKGKALLGEGLR